MIRIRTMLRVFCTSGMSISLPFQKYICNINMLKIYVFFDIDGMLIGYTYSFLYH
jgi:hypothetical protein